MNWTGNCVICTEVLRGPVYYLGSEHAGNPIATVCGHAFHTYCLYQWASTGIGPTFQCPTCRRQLSRTSPEEYRHDPEYTYQAPARRESESDYRTIYRYNQLVPGEQRGIYRRVSVIQQISAECGMFAVYFAWCIRMNMANAVADPERFLQFLEDHAQDRSKACSLMM